MFWRYTLRESYLMCKSYHLNQVREWERTRNLEFTNYNVQYGAMDGKKIFKHFNKPSDLYRLETDYDIEVKIDKEQQKRSVDNVKLTKNFQQWQMNS